MVIRYAFYPKNYYLYFLHGHFVVIPKQGNIFELESDKKISIFSQSLIFDLLQNSIYWRREREREREKEREWERKRLLGCLEGETCVLAHHKNKMRAEDILLQRV